MAKVAAKTSSKDSKSSASTAKRASSSRPKAQSEVNIEKVCEETLDKLKSLGIDEQLQRDIEWCLGSYRADQNPVGLYDMAQRALVVLKAEKEKKTKGVTAKMVTDLEKALNGKSA